MPHEKLIPQFSFTRDRLRELESVVPEAFADGAVNWDTLREALGEFLEDGESANESFGLTWPGKREARRLAAKPSHGALIPAPGEGINEETTKNLFIEGDNLEVLKLLQKSYAGRVKMIYIDPPYNTGNDFIYKDDFSEPLDIYLERSGQIGEGGELLSSNPKSSGRFHSNWLNMIYPRLRLARMLLRDDGAIFVSIDDNEVHNLRAIMNEIFGEENFVATITWEGALKNDSRFVSNSHDYVLCYVKGKEFLSADGVKWRTRKEGIDEIYTKEKELRAIYNTDYEVMTLELRKWFASLQKDNPAYLHRHYNRIDRVGVFFAGDISWPGSGGPRYDVIHPTTRKPVRIPRSGWRVTDPKKMQQMIDQERVEFGLDENRVPMLKRYLKETEGQVLPSVIYKDRRASMQRLRSLMDGDFFDNPKDEDILIKLLEATTNSRENDIVMDFFAGSGTTAHAVLKLNNEDGGNRQFIMVQVPEQIDIGYFTNIAEISKERIRRVLIKLSEQPTLPTREIPEDLGFKVFKLAPSNLKQWRENEDVTPEQLPLLFDGQETPLCDGWTPDDLRAEVLLIEGFPLDSTVEKQPFFSKNAVFLITSPTCGHRLWTCFDEKLQPQTLENFAFNSEDVFVCLDSALNDGAKLRLASQCNLKTI